MRAVKPDVVVVIPTHRPTLTANEEISLRQCLQVLGDYPVHVVCPKSMDAGELTRRSDRITVDRVADRCMGSRQAYNRLMVSDHFYRRYERFEWILTYQLDAFVFEDRLPQWCAESIDFIGAPWFAGFQEPRPVRRSERPIAVGNSGLCLRRTAAFRRVLREYPLARRVPGFLGDLARTLARGRWKGAYESLRHRSGLTYLGPEDVFWGMQVPVRFPWFRVPSPEVAMQFSFDSFPEVLYRLNRRQLPFGCHAWERWGGGFWKPFIEAYGYRLQPTGT